MQKKMFDKVQHPFHNSHSQKVMNRGNYLNLIKSIYKTSTSDPYIMLKD